MNTIPSTFSAAFPPYTVLGGKDSGARSGVGAALLNRCGRVGRKAVFEELEKAGFDGVISVECGGERYDVEELAACFPRVTFVLLKGEASPGCRINIAAHETKSPLFFALWDDMRLSGIKAERIGERLRAARADGRGGNGDPRPPRRLCTVPVIENQALQVIPTMNAPVIGKKSFDCAPLLPKGDDFPALYPYDGCGVYDRARFIGMGGFDPRITSPYWQYLDFGLRAWLWGEETLCDKPVRLCLEGVPAPEESTPDESYLRFYLKNLAPVIRPGQARLPLTRFAPFALRSRLGPAASWALFREARLWVREHAARFRVALPDLAGIWREPPA